MSDARDPAGGRAGEGAPRRPNALLHASSPYLRQHAYNPVDWRTWGPEAFAEARQRGVPVFLSVGYSTCHWCHVMEHESFEDAEVAAALNAHTVPVKVDREERPDVDAVYMSFVQLTTGRGGWPMTVWLTPEGRPLFGGTYFPARDGDRPGMRGLLTLIEGLAEIWADPAFQAQGDAAIEAMAERPEPAKALPGPELVWTAARAFLAHHDAVHGGFGRAPKFPRPSVLDLLLRVGRRAPAALEAVERTLDKMALGGLYDHLEGGFARYSTDAEWRVPHFEKMLYDNAQLASTCLAAYQATGDPRWRGVAEDVLAWMAGPMGQPAGGFSSATDADSRDAAGHLHEGLFATWTPDEIVAALGPTDGAFVNRLFGVDAAGHLDGRSVLHLQAPLEGADLARWQTLRPRLQAVRATRPAPALDDKVITAWNGLAISAFAQAGRLLEAPAWTERARAAADFALTHLRDARGRLYRSWRDGQPGPGGVLDDYAALALGLLDLLEATGEVRWLVEAQAIFSLMNKHFADDAGGWFRTPDDAERLAFREKPDQDGAEPSGNALGAQVALRLAAITGDAALQRQAAAAVQAVATLAQRVPMAAPRLLCALHALHAGDQLVIIVTPDATPPTALLAACAEAGGPDTVVLFGPADGPLAAAVPAFEGRTALGGRPTAWHCRGTACDLPVTEPAELVALLRDPSSEG
ncbi:MAG: thioredoxin domain-containing protein [Myxococcales bacterium]|nr:thioredoxin domain-containing protein [Myxococcales bacterium]